MKPRICVAHYNEDISWTQKVPGFDFIFYHKNNLQNLQDYLDYSIVDDCNVNLANVGKEGHTYLHHIVRNYDNLRDVEVFCQGSPFEHCSGFNEELSSFLNDPKFIQTGFFQFGNITTCLVLSSLQQSVKEDVNATFSSDLSIQEISRANFFHVNSIFLDLFGEQIPEHSQLKANAQFACTRWAIRRHPIELYERLISLFQDNRKNDVAAWRMEYFWHLLFEHTFNLKYDPKNHFLPL
jgi:hypothetical protein